jgi:hypothetical protein
MTKGLASLFDFLDCFVSILSFFVKMSENSTEDEQDPEES